MNFKSREQMLVLAALLCLGTLAADRWLITPLRALWTAREARISELEKSVNQGSALMERQEAIQQRWQYIQQNCLPKDTSIAADQVLKSVDRWKMESRLSVNSQKPQWIQKEDEYTTFELRIAAVGDLRSIVHFLYDMEKDSLPLKVEEMDVTTQDEKGAKFSLGLRFSGLRLVEKKS